MWKYLLNKRSVAGLTRHLMTTIGGAVVTGGYASGSEWETITGGAVVLTGAIWSLLDKKELI